MKNHVYRHICIYDTFIKVGGCTILGHKPGCSSYSKVIMLHMFHPHLCLKSNLYYKMLLSTANDDYSTILQPSMVTFPIGSVAGDIQCFGVTIINDELVEGNENFFLNLVSTNAQVTVDQTRDQATVNIIDEDSRSCLFFSIFSQY